MQMTNMKGGNQKTFVIYDFRFAIYDFFFYLSSPCEMGKTVISWSKSVSNKTMFEKTKPIFERSK
jgi:hypothetical protein